MKDRPPLRTEIDFVPVTIDVPPINRRENKYPDRRDGNPRVPVRARGTFRRPVDYCVIGSGLLLVFFSLFFCLNSFDRPVNVRGPSTEIAAERITRTFPRPA